MRRLRSRRLGASVGPAGAAPRFLEAGGKPGRAAASAQEPRRRSAPEGLTPLTLPHTAQMFGCAPARHAAMQPAHGCTRGIILAGGLIATIAPRHHRILP